MPMNLVRSGGAAAVGLASGVLNPAVIAPLDLGGTQIGWDFVTEGVGLAAGSVLQIMSPFTAPDLVDGVVAGSIALLGRRAGAYVAHKLRPTSTSAPAFLENFVAQQVAPARGYIGNLNTGAQKVRLS